jgi:hypothetical protein
MIDRRLLGKWESVPGTADETVSVEFTADGSLTYTVHAGRTDQTMLLRYRVDDEVIVSDQPSDPREERTNYRITGDDHLVLTYEGEEAIYRRVN